MKKYHALLFLKDLLMTEDEKLIEYFDKKILNWLYKLAENPRKHDTLLQFNKESDPHFSALFYNLLLECFKIWGHKYQQWTKMNKYFQELQSRNLLDVEIHHYYLPSQPETKVDLQKYQRELEFLKQIRKKMIELYLESDGNRTSELTSSIDKYLVKAEKFLNHKLTKLVQQEYSHTDQAQQVFCEWNFHEFFLKFFENKISGENKEFLIRKASILLEETYQVEDKEEFSMPFSKELLLESLKSQELSEQVIEVKEKKEGRKEPKDVEFTFQNSIVQNNKKAKSFKHSKGQLSFPVKLVEH